MRFHGLMLVRDEDDIIGETIQKALSWIDSIWVLDTGSTDETYTILEELSASDTRIRLLGRHELTFNQSLRSYVFQEARAYFSDGDWIIKMDADEIHYISPPEFVKNYVSRLDGAIYLRWYYFRLTEGEANNYLSGEVDVYQDRKLSIIERRRFYKIPSHSEPRLFKYRPTMRFHHGNNWPFYAGQKCRYQIPIMHFPHRDPVQMKKRFSLRNRMKKMGSTASSHWEVDDWRNELIANEYSGPNPRSLLANEMGHDDDRLRHWLPGDTLPDITGPVRANFFTSSAKKIFYFWPVRLADRLKAGFSDTEFLADRSVRLNKMSKTMRSSKSE